jgi:hypothetical protein
LSIFLRFPFGPLFLALFASLSASFRSRAALQLEILALRHQVGVLQRSVKRPKLTPADGSGANVNLLGKIDRCHSWYR